MTDNRGGLSRLALRLTLTAAMAAALAGCGSVADPTSWFDDSTPPATTGQQPDLAAVPGRPTPPSSAEQNVQVADSLAADRTQAQYSSEALRGGTEAAAAPPPASPPPEQPLPEETAPQPAREGAPDGSTEAAAAPTPAEPAPAAPEPAPQTATMQPSSQPGTLPPPAQMAGQQAASAAAPAYTAAPSVQTQAVPAPVSSPSMPSAPVPGAQAAMATGGALGFAPSSAPPLNPSVSQFVPASTIARYEQTAKLEPPKYPAWSGSAGTAAAVVTFPNDTTVLNEAAREQVRSVAQAFLSRGGQGYVRIVGQASRSTGSLSAERLLSVNFEHSQARARAVARALISAGVPADKVLIDTAGSPAPQAAAEIYLQS